MWSLAIFETVTPSRVWACSMPRNGELWAILPYPPSDWMVVTVYAKFVPTDVNNSVYAQGVDFWKWDGSFPRGVGGVTCVRSIEEPGMHLSPLTSSQLVNCQKMTKLFAISLRVAHGNRLRSFHNFSSFVADLNQVPLYLLKPRKTWWRNSPALKTRV